MRSCAAAIRSNAQLRGSVLKGSQVWVDLPHHLMGERPVPVSRIFARRSAKKSLATIGQSTHPYDPPATRERARTWPRNLESANGRAPNKTSARIRRVHYRGDAVSPDKAGELLAIRRRPHHAEIPGWARWAGCGSGAEGAEKNQCVAAARVEDRRYRRLAGR